jgi:hypothetical protein
VAKDVPECKDMVQAVKLCRLSLHKFLSYKDRNDNRIRQQAYPDCGERSAYKYKIRSERVQTL